MKIPSRLLRPPAPCATLRIPNDARRRWPRVLVRRNVHASCPSARRSPHPQSGRRPALLRLHSPAPGDQSASASQVSTVSTSLSQVSSLRGRWTAWEPEADCLVLASGGEYYRFERNGVDVSGLIPGDPVTVTYTGALDPEEGTVSADLLSITKDTL